MNFGDVVVGGSFSMAQSSSSGARFGSLLAHHSSTMQPTLILASSICDHHRLANIEVTKKFMQCNLALNILRT